MHRASLVERSIFSPRLDTRVSERHLGLSWLLMAQAITLVGVTLEANAMSSSARMFSRISTKVEKRVALLLTKKNRVGKVPNLFKGRVCEPVKIPF